MLESYTQRRNIMTTSEIKYQAGQAIQRLVNSGNAGELLYRYVGEQLSDAELLELAKTEVAS